MTPDWPREFVMAVHKWHVFYDRRDRLCYKTQGTNAIVTTLSEDQYLVIVGSKKTVVRGPRDEALKTAIDWLDKMPATNEG